MLRLSPRVLIASATGLLAANPATCQSPLTPAKPQDPPRSDQNANAADDGKPEPQGIRVLVEGEVDTTTPHAPSSVTGSKAPVPFLQNPRHVDTIDQQAIRDQGATEAPELWRYVPNAIVGERGVVRIRGFAIGQSAASGGQLFDGVRSSVYNLIGTNLYNVERVEVLKGPAGVMYGQGQPGGLVNYVLKKPREEQFDELRLNWDSWGQQRLAIDSTGPLTEAKDWLYRVNVSTEESETFRQKETQSSLYVAPALTWRPSGDLRVSLLLEAFKDRRTGGRGYGTPVIQGDVFAMPRDYSISDVDDYREVTGMDAQLQIEANVADGATLTTTLFGGRSYYENMYHEGQRSAAEDAAGDLSYRRQFRNQRSDTRQWGYDMHLLWERQGRELGHRVLIGTDYTGIRDPQFPAIDAYITNPTTASNTDGANPVDLGAPYAGQASRAGYGVDSSQVTTGERSNFGVYGDYRLAIRESLFASVGGRYDAFEEDTTTNNRITDSVSSTSDDHDRLSISASLLWQFSETASTYYAFNQGFRAQGWTTVNNANGPFDPLTWDQHEIGASYENEQRTFGANLALFQITRNHELVPDTSVGAPSGASVDVGKTRSEGVEATINGRLSDDTTVTAVYGYNDAYVYQTSRLNRDGTASLKGARLASVPHNTASLTVAHQLRPDLRLWASGRFVGSQKARLDGTDPLNVKLPQYYTIDVGATYVRDDWEVRVGIDNLLDEDYVTLYRSPGHAVNRGEPRTLSVMFTARF